MKINIITTEKTLTKAVVNQMCSATTKILREGHCLGYVVGAKKDSHKTIILEHLGDYYTKSMHWTLGDDNQICRPGKKGIITMYKRECDRKGWWEAYKKIKEIALQNHIYI